MPLADDTAPRVFIGHNEAPGRPATGELVGPYKNAGRRWRRAGEPVRVNVLDFLDPDLGKANPYGVYDVAANAGWVLVGTDHDTAAFAVTTIGAGSTRSAKTPTHAPTGCWSALTGGGSNGYRLRAWKTELATLAAETGLTITVCHLPPGTSKWNRIEHRLFSHVSMNWRRRPLTSHQVIVDLIGGTTTRTRTEGPRYPHGHEGDTQDAMADSGHRRPAAIASCSPAETSE